MGVLENFNNEIMVCVCVFPMSVYLLASVFYPICIRMYGIDIPANF